MAILDIRVPDEIGDVEECVIVTWLKRVGDPVKADDILVILQAAKVSFEIPVPAPGTVQAILAEQGEVVDEGQVIAQLAVNEAAVSSQTPAATTSVAAAATAAPTPPRDVRASPIAKRIAREQGIDLAQVTGSGEEGRISEKDVLAYLDAQRAQPTASSPTPSAKPSSASSSGPVPVQREREVRSSPIARRLAKEHGIDLAQVTGSGEGGRIGEKDVLAYLDAQGAEPVVAPPTAASPTAIPLTGMRAIIAQRMHESLQTMAQLTMSAEIDVTALVKRRAALKGQLDLSYTDLLIKAVALALPNHPRLNSWLIDNELQVQSACHIGMAVALDDGLIVPVIRHAEQLNLRQLAGETKRLAQQARANTLKPNEASGSTFTITNLGMYGIDRFTPIVNPPEVAILGVGAITERLTRQGDDLQWRQFLVLSLTIDHRAVDGAPGAQFLQGLRGLLEAPNWVTAA